MSAIYMQNLEDGLDLTSWSHLSLDDNSDWAWCVQRLDSCGIELVELFSLSDKAVRICWVSSLVIQTVTVIDVPYTFMP